VIAAEIPRFGGKKNTHAQGWLVSILLHTAVAFGALLLMKQLHLAPQEEPFKWNVALMSPAQPVQPAASAANQSPAEPVPSTNSVPSFPMTQTSPARRLPSPKPLLRQTTPLMSERAGDPVMTESPAPPLRPTTPSQSAVHTTQPAEPIKQETAAPTVAEGTPIVKPDEAPMVVSGGSTAQTVPSSALPQAIEQLNQAPMQMATLPPAPANTPSPRDYAWLSETVLRRVEEVKRYPASARMERAEGKVVVKAVIKEDGSIGEVEVFQSSGYPSIDRAALETLREAAPFSLPRPLGRPGMAIKIPMSYRLER
jgi:periplasmic protein TonB